MWDCASQLRVPGRSRVHGRPYLSFCPITLQQFQVLMSMQMDACLKKEQICTLFVWVGHQKKGLGGGWWVRGVQPKNWACLSKFLFWTPPGTMEKKHFWQ